MKRSFISAFSARRDTPSFRATSNDALDHVTAQAAVLIFVGDDECHLGRVIDVPAHHAGDADNLAASVCFGVLV